MANQIDEDEPLDPVMEKVRVKMVRLLGISIGLMLLALITVLGAVVYKISQGSETSETEADNTQPNLQTTNNIVLLENLEVDVPEGARVISSNLSSGNLLLDLRLSDGARQFWIVDLQSGDVKSRVSLK
jgi:hypothetical protein